MRFRENGPALVGVIHLRPSGVAPLVAHDGLASGAHRRGRPRARRGFDAVLVENFGDAPFYRDAVPPETVAAMAVLVGVAGAASGLPVVNILATTAPRRWRWQ